MADTHDCQTEAVVLDVGWMKCTAVQKFVIADCALHSVITTSVKIKTILMIYCLHNASGEISPDVLKYSVERKAFPMSH